MPSLYVHYKFGEDVLTKLPKNLKAKINSHKTLYHIFNQGNDNLYYYIFKLSYYRNLGIKFHHNKIDVFFANALLYLKENPQVDSGIIYAFINHYVLDTLMHPLINSLVKQEKISHTKIEYLLDYYLYGNKMWPPKYYQELIPRVKFNKELKTFLKTIYLETYEIDHIDKVFNRSHNNAYYLYRYLIYDQYGIKSKLYSLIDKLFHQDLSANTFYIPKFNDNLLNNTKNDWHHPQNQEEIYNYSFQEIYDISLNIAIFLNKLAYNVIYNEEDINKFTKYINLVNLKNIAKFPL